jgi:hypothetical protein
VDATVESGIERVRDEGPVVSGTRRGRGGGLVRWVTSDSTSRDCLGPDEEYREDAAQKRATGEESPQWEASVLRVRRRLEKIGSSTGLWKRLSNISKLP